jgi:beta-glucanase (GH16 family)
VSTRQLVLIASAYIAGAVVLPASASAAVTAKYTYTPSTPVVETTTTFNGSASVCDRKPCSFTWRDDGADGPGGDSTLLGTGSMLLHTFHTAGDKFIRLTVTNRKGRPSSTVKTISVSGAPTPTPPADGDGDGVADAQDACPALAGSPPDGCPVPTPAFSFTPSAPTVGQQVSFDASTTACRATPCSYAWSHSGTVFASGRTATFTYQTSGVKTVTLQVTDAQSRSASLSRSFTVGDVSSPPPPPAGEPGPIAGQGYTVRFQDDFNSLDATDWGMGIWYDPGSPPNSIFVQNGILNLVSRRSQGYQNITVSTEAGTSPKTFKYGYFEARMKWTKGNGAWPAFWLYSYRHATNPAWPNINPVCSQLGEPLSHCWAGEIDVFEGQGNDPSGYYGTIHENSCGSCNYGPADRQNANNYTNVAPVDLTTGFHTYAVRWTATDVKWYLDGQLLQTATPYESLNQPMFLLFDMFIGGWSGGTDASTPDELKTEVDWVKVWQK